MQENCRRYWNIQNGEILVKLLIRQKQLVKTVILIYQDHFVDVNKMVQLGSGAEREIEDIMLSRYACYLIVQNSDPRKEVVALGQTYFAVKTREREIEENFNELTEEQKRLAIRNELKTHNKSLAEAAQMAGVRTGMDYCYFSK